MNLFLHAMKLQLNMLYWTMDKKYDLKAFFDGFHKIIVHEYVSIKIENHPIWVSKKIVVIFSSDLDENPYRFVKMSGLMESRNLFLDPLLCL